MRCASVQEIKKEKESVEHMKWLVLVLLREIVGVVIRIVAEFNYKIEF